MVAICIEADDLKVSRALKIRPPTAAEGTITTN